MTKNLFIILFISVFLFSCGNKKENGKDAAKTDEVAATVTVANLLDNPDEYIDKLVRISGTVTHVCKHGGKKLFIFDEDPDKTLRITVGEKLSEFDVTLEGDEVLFEGTFRQLIMDEAYVDQLEEDMKQVEQAEGEEHSHAEGEEHVEGEELAEGEVLGEHEHEGDEMENIQNLRDKIAESEEGQIIDFWIEQLGFEVMEEGEVEEEGAEDEGTEEEK